MNTNSGLQAEPMPANVTGGTLAATVGDWSINWLDAVLDSSMYADLLEGMWARDMPKPQRLAIIRGAYALRRDADRDWSFFCKWGAFA